MGYGTIRLVVDIFCILFLAALAWMWIIGAPLDEWLAKRKAKQRIKQRMRR